MQSRLITILLLERPIPKSQHLRGKRYSRKGFPSLVGQGYPLHHSGAAHPLMLPRATLALESPPHATESWCCRATWPSSCSREASVWNPKTALSIPTLLHLGRLTFAHGATLWGHLSFQRTPSTYPVLLHLQTIHKLGMHTLQALV